MRMMKLGLAAAGLIAAISVAQVDPAVAGGTTRIETRPFYGAIVTIEEGVRVFRPLPGPERVIINPGGRTPLSLGFNETTVNERRYNYNYVEGSSEGAAPTGVYGGYYGYGTGHGGHRGGGGGRGMGGPGGHGIGAPR